MSTNVNVLLASRDPAIAPMIETCLRRVDGIVTERALMNGHADPLHGREKMPDVIVLHLSDSWRDELEALSRRPANTRPPALVLGPGDDVDVMRLAIRAGARDFLTLPLVEEELLEALIRIIKDRQTSDGAGSGAVITTFMNAKGGSGATMLASNVAHVMAAVSNQRVALIDLDFQFGTLPLYFDLYPKRGLNQALANLDELDDVALAGYMSRHDSGVQVLGNSEADTLATQDVTASHIVRLLELLAQGHDRIVVDLPRRIDDVSVSVLERAEHIVIVLQQSLTTLRDASRLMIMMCRDLAVPRDKVCVVVNRYDKNAAVTLSDIETTLKCGSPVLIPNDFRTVTDCINTGQLLYARSRGAAVTKAVMALETRIGGSSVVSGQGMLSRVFSNFKPKALR